MEFDEGFSVEMNKPGCFHTVCVELDIISLAINTLMQVTEKSLVFLTHQCTGAIIAVIILTGDHTLCGRCGILYKCIRIHQNMSFSDKMMKNRKVD